jgi:hypothetical protein
MWNNLEDVRVAKSYLGQAMMAAGALTTAYGVDRRNTTATAVGVGLLAAGLAARAGAAADTRYCDALPQRVYVVPLLLTDPQEQIELMVEGRPGSRLVVTGLGAPPGQQAQLRYVRLLSPNRQLVEMAPPAWAVSGEIHYSNDHTGDAPAAGDLGRLPYILGGRDVRVPNDQVMGLYRQAGFLRQVMTAELSSSTVRKVSASSDSRRGELPAATCWRAATRWSRRCRARRDSLDCSARSTRLTSLDPTTCAPRCSNRLPAPPPRRPRPKEIDPCPTLATL